VKKAILITIAVASLSTTALADARVAGHRTHHSHVVTGAAVNPALLNANASLNANARLNGNGGDHTMHVRNTHDSGYDPKNDRDSLGNMTVAQ
jgi:hypothetical protein